MSKHPLVWVLHDDKTNHKYIKKRLDDGSLAVFDTEEDAMRAKLRCAGSNYSESVLISNGKYDLFISDTQVRLDAMRLAIQCFVDAWQESGCWPDTDSEKNAIDQAFNECKKILTAELQREPVGGDV